MKAARPTKWGRGAGETGESGGWDGPGPEQVRGGSAPPGQEKSKRGQVAKAPPGTTQREAQALPVNKGGEGP